MTVCAKCGYQRTFDDHHPAGECPHCKSPYPPLVALTASAREVGAEMVVDTSALALLAANGVTIAIAVRTAMDVREVMLVYWAQSVIIGVSFFIRTLALREYPTVPAVGGTLENSAIVRIVFGKYFNAFFFLVHYSGFHAVYLGFLASGQPRVFPPLLDFFWLCVLAFAISHGYSLWRNIEQDRRSTPSATTLFWLPYARIVPMHLTLIFGRSIPGASGALVYFLGLKTLADLVMHVIEHRVLRAGRK